MSASSVNEFCHYATASELDYLRALAATLPSRAKVVMLGAGPGVMMLAVVEGNPSVLGLVVDHDTTQWVEKHLEPLKPHQVIFQVADSAAIGQGWPTADIALLIIDADHSYEGVTRDMLAWLPHVAEGGYVFFHDYSAAGTEFADQEQYPGVALAVGQYLPQNYTTVARAGTAMIFRNDP